MMMVPALLCAALLLLPGILTTPYEPYPITVVVENSLLGSRQSFSTLMANGGILLGAMKRLMHSNADFKFTYTENPDYGVYLESVNGLAGNDNEQTFWELLVPDDHGVYEQANVGIGCYIPKAGEQIILRYTTYDVPHHS